MMVVQRGHGRPSRVLSVSDKTIVLLCGQLDAGDLSLILAEESTYSLLSLRRHASKQLIGVKTGG